MNSYWRTKFAWSNTRHGMWHECKKQYYFHYIKVFDGLPNDKGKQLLWELRKMQKIAFLKGRLIHDTIKEQITASSEGRFDPDTMIQSFNSKFNDNLSLKNSVVTEVYNGYSISELEMEAYRRDSILQLQNFCNSIWPTFTGSQYIEHEQLVKFSHSGLDIWVAIDLFTKKGDIFVVSDWKTGGESDDDISENVQLGIYLLWAHETKNIPMEKLEGELVYLRTGSRKITTRDEKQLEELKLFIRRDAEEMLAVKNEDDFPASPSKHKCRGCNFLTICKEGKQILGREN